MSFLEKMKWRYACKEYDKTKSIDPNDLQHLKEILQLTPSSINSQPWKFIFVRDAQVRSQLADVSYSNNERILDCDTLVAFTRPKNVETFEQEAQSYLTPESLNFWNQIKSQLNEGQLLDWFNRQVYIALGVLLSACAEKSIDSTPMEGLMPQHYDEILKLDNHTTLCAVCLGYRNPDDYNQPNKKPKSRRALNEIIADV